MGDVVVVAERLVYRRFNRGGKLFSDGWSLCEVEPLVWREIEAGGSRLVYFRF